MILITSRNFNKLDIEILLNFKDFKHSCFVKTFREISLKIILNQQNYYTENLELYKLFKACFVRNNLVIKRHFQVEKKNFS